MDYIIFIFYIAISAFTMFTVYFLLQKKFPSLRVNVEKIKGKKDLKLNYYILGDTN